MRPMPPTNKNSTYSPLILLIVTNQSRIRGKSYSPLDLQPFKFLFAFLVPGFFLPLTQSEFSRFRFPDRFMAVSRQIRPTFLSHEPQMKHKLFVNTLGNLMDM